MGVINHWAGDDLQSCLPRPKREHFCWWLSRGSTAARVKKTRPWFTFMNCAVTGLMPILRLYKWAMRLSWLRGSADSSRSSSSKNGQTVYRLDYKRGWEASCWRAREEAAEQFTRVARGGTVGWDSTSSEEGELRLRADQNESQRKETSVPG